MPLHREEGRFVVRIELSAEFEDEYEGDDDGYAWLERFRTEVQPRIVRRVYEELRGHPAVTAIPANRGKSPEVEVEIDVRWRQAGRGTPRS